MTLIYLDVCCLNRPFDNQAQPRVHLEAEAVLIILARFRQRQWDWLGSTVVETEIAQDPNPDRQARIQLLLSAMGRTVLVRTSEAERAKTLTQLGVPAMDALHLACAESGGADVFLTTDDRLLRQTKRLSAQLRVRVANPLTWIEEMNEI